MRQLDQLAGLRLVDTGDVDLQLDGEAEGHLGLGFPTALGAAELHGWDDEVLSTLIRRAGSDGGLLPPAAAPFFRLEKAVVASETRLAPGFAVLIVIEGDLVLRSDAGRSDTAVQVTAGSTVVAPYAAGELAVEGNGELLVFRPPEIDG